MTPRLPPRGFSESRQKQPRNKLHPYRRITGGECFVISREKFVSARNNLGHWHPRLSLLVNSPSLLSQFFIKGYALVPNLLPFLASLRLTIRPASRRASPRLFIYT